MRKLIFIHVIVLWAPNAASPTISPSSPLYIQDGGSLALTCEIDQDVAGVTWNRNGYSAIQITNTTVCIFRPFITRDSCNYSVTCDQQRRFRMVKCGVNSSDHNTSWTCSMYALDYTVLGPSSAVRVLMRVPVGSVQLLNGTRLTLIENQTAVLVCETNACRPNAAIYWMKDGNNITDIPTSVTTVNLDNDLFVSSGTLSYTGQREDNRKILTCGAYNGLESGHTSGNLTVTIYYPPSIQGLTSLYLVIEYQPLNVTCLVSSNPPPDRIFWTPTGEGSVPSMLYFSSVSRKNSGTYSCKAQNTMIPTFGATQTGTSISQIQVDVLYAAKITEFVANRNIYEIMENSTISLYCHVDSNPHPVISLSFSNVLISTIQDSNALIHNVTAGCLDAGKYICSATNSVMNGVTSSAEVSLKVYCGPRPDHRKNISTVYYRALNDNVSLEVNIIAYPEPTYIVWYHRGYKTDTWQQVPKQLISSSGLFSSITVHLDSPADFGDYLVNMTNSFGIYELVFHVIQECTCKTSCAEIKENTIQNTLIVASAILFCLAICLFVATLVLIIRSRRGICIGCMNGRSETDAKIVDIGHGQPSTYDDFATFHASTSGKTRDDYEQLNRGNTAEHEEPSHDHTMAEYEELSKGSESQSKFGNHLYGNTTVTSNM